MEMNIPYRILFKQLMPNLEFVHLENIFQVTGISNLAGGLVVLVTVFGSSSARGDTEFLLDNTTPSLIDGLQNGDVVISEGITMTFSNVVASDGGASGDVEGVGILISGIVDTELQDVISFDLTFSHDVLVSSYDIGGREDVQAGRFFTLTGSNGVSGENVVPAITGSALQEVALPFLPGTVSLFEADQAYSFSHNLQNDELIDELFNLEAIYVTKVSSLVADFESLGGKTGRLGYQADWGFRYSLQRSLDLASTPTEIGSFFGNGSPSSLSFDDTLSGLDKAFFWIERTPITRSPIAPATFVSGAAAEVFYSDFPGESIIMTALPGNGLNAVAIWSDGVNVPLFGSAATYAYGNSGGVVTLSGTMSQSTISDAQILSQLNAELADVNSPLSLAAANLSDFPTEEDMEAVVDAIIDTTSGFTVDYDGNNSFFIVREGNLLLNSNSEGTFRLAGPGLTFIDDDTMLDLVGEERSYTDNVKVLFR